MGGTEEVRYGMNDDESQKSHRLLWASLTSGSRELVNVWRRVNSNQHSFMEKENQFCLFHETDIVLILKSGRNDPKAEQVQVYRASRCAGQRQWHRYSTGVPGLVEVAQEWCRWYFQ